MLESLFNKVAFLVPATSSKKTPNEVLSCETCNDFEEMSTSKLYLKRDSDIGVFL